jgi:hypothetical protein
MQRAENSTVEEEVFSMWSTYIHCWATKVFSMGPPQDYISSPVIEQERELGKPSAEKGRRVRLKSGCELL